MFGADVIDESESDSNFTSGTVSSEEDGECEIESWSDSGDESASKDE
jgi:hypothetical protein